MAFKAPAQLSFLDFAILTVFAEEATKQAKEEKRENLPAVRITQREILDRLHQRGIKICLRTLKYHIKALKERGFLTVERRYTKVWNEEERRYVPRQLPGLYRLTRRALEAAVWAFRSAGAIFRAAGLTLAPSRLPEEKLQALCDTAKDLLSRTRETATTLLAMLGAATVLAQRRVPIPAYLWAPVQRLRR